MSAVAAAARILGLFGLCCSLGTIGLARAAGVTDGSGHPSAQAVRPGTVPGTVIDRVVAVVDGRVLTSSELKLEAKVALVERVGTAGISMPLDTAALRSALWLAIAQRVEVAQAERLRAYPVSQAEVAARLKAFRERFASRSAYEAFLEGQGADESRLAEILARELRASRMLDGQVRLEAQVSDQEVATYYHSHSATWGAPLAKVREAIRAKLSATRYQRLVSQAVAAARESPGVRLIAPFARGQGS